MITRHYSGEQRRALNIIWNTAGRYDFDPPFMAFRPSGDIDFYMNCVIGLADKYLGGDWLSELFERYGGSADVEEIDAIVWLALENWLYEREVSDRPILKKLRERHAEEFYHDRANLSRQQMMLLSGMVNDQQEARWSAVLGRKRPFLGPGASMLAEELKLSGILTAREVQERTERLLKEHFARDLGTAGNRKIKVSSRNAALLRHLLRREERHTDLLVTRNPAAAVQEVPEGKTRGAGRESFFGRRSDAHAGENLAYIQKYFGTCMLGETQLRGMENDLCRNSHAYCRLWVCREGVGELPANDTAAENRDKAEQKRQYESNRTYAKHHARLIRSSILRLSAGIETVFSSAARHLPERSKEGRLKPEYAYRMKIMKDRYAFRRDAEETEYDLTVDLLLDASASRMNGQEMIAVQSRIIAESLEKNGIPVRVTAFRSLRGYTVMQILKDYREHDTGTLLHYYAAGWNRDSLALEAASYLMPGSSYPGTGAAGRKNEAGAGRKLLLILTDAAPGDSTGMPPAEGKPFGQAYESSVAVEDTAQAVARIRRVGIDVAAVFTGPTASLEQLHRIYGSYYVRIRKIGEMADAVTELLEQIMRKAK